MHAEQCGPTWLKDERVATVVADALHWRDGQGYRLDAYCIMSNHVHAVFAPYLSEASLQPGQTEDGLLYESEEPPLDVIMHSLKSWTAQQANAVLGRNGQFWQHESYDHVVRDDAEFAALSITSCTTRSRPDWCKTGENGAGTGNASEPVRQASSLSDHRARISLFNVIGL